MSLDREQNYILTEDTMSMFNRIGNIDDPTNRGGFEEATEKYFQVVTKLLSQALPEMKVLPYSEKQIERVMNARVEGLMKIYPNLFCVCLDRYLLTEIENNDELKDRFFRFNVCRTTEDIKVPRQGSKPLNEQVSELVRKIGKSKKIKLLIADDGVFTGGTIKELISLLKERGINCSVEFVVGYIGDYFVKDKIESRAKIIIAEPQTNMRDWLDQRDASPLAGRQLAASKTGMVTSSVPYIFPWSNGEVASLNLSPELLSTSKGIIEEFIILVENYEQSRGNKPLTFRELLKAGFPLPTNIQKNIPVSINTELVDYLRYCLERIAIEQDREVFVFDMDGTFYKLDGKDNGFLGSRLAENVKRNAMAFIKAKDKCSEAEAVQIYEEGKADVVGLSNFLAQRYGISRQDYFNEVWNINPNGIVQDFESAVMALKEIKKDFPGRKLILLTSAPSVWANNVLRMLGIAEDFELVFTGEMYKTKDDIFKVLEGRYKTEKIVSIGDQFETDIKPAQERGMNGFLVNSPSDLLLLVEQLKNAASNN